jgi:NAD(P)-dependent dehydrogenase (short-subunit alcohol dehydrogenase family)
MHSHLDVLINNAAVLPSEPRDTADGFDETFATNTLGPYLLTRWLMPALERAHGRVVGITMSSCHIIAFDIILLPVDQRDQRWFVYDESVPG